jgi:hypothetical protein
MDAGENMPELRAIATEIGMPEDKMRAGVRALVDAEPPYIAVSYAGGEAIGHLVAVYERTRRELGSWPSAPTLVDEIVAALIAAAEIEEEPERKGRLRAAAETIGGIARDLSVAVVAAQIGKVE